MKILEINALHDFRAIKNEWNSLLASSKDRNIFFTWDWNYLWYKHYRKDKKLSILIFEECGEMRGIVPLLRKNHSILGVNCSYLENMGIPNSDYGGIIISDNCNEIADQIFDLLARFIREHKLSLRLDQIPISPKIEELKNRLSSNNFFIREQSMSQCHYLSLQGSWEEYRAKLSRKFIKEIERSKRRFERNIGEISFRRSSSVEELTNDFDLFLDLEGKKRQHKGFEQIKNVEKGFLYDITQNFLANNWLYLSFLEVDGDAIACDLGFEYNNTYYAYMTAFDPSYHSYPIGKIHLYLILKDLFGRGLNELDFLRGDEAFKSFWNTSKRTNERIIACTDSIGFNIKSNFIDLLIRYDDMRGLGQDFRTNCAYVLNFIKNI